MRKRLFRCVSAALVGLGLASVLMLLLLTGLQRSLAQAVSAVSLATGDPFPIAAVSGNDESVPVGTRSERRPARTRVGGHFPADSGRLRAREAPTHDRVRSSVDRE